MTITKHLATVAEKYRETAQQLHAFITKRSGKHAVELRSGGVIAYGIGSDDFMLLGFAVRSAGVTLYASADVLMDHAGELGKKKTGVTCLRLRKMADVDTKVLNDIVRRSLKKKQMNYGTCGS